MMSQTSIIPEIKLNPTPSFYNNAGGGPLISRTNGALEIGSTLIPVIKIVTEEVKILSAGQEFDIYHNLGKAYEVFIRYKVRGAASWRMVYIPDYIDESKVHFTFNETPSTTPYIYQLFFTLFTI